MTIHTFANMIGKTITKINGKEGNDELTFIADGWRWRLYHGQDCCEQVYLEDVCGDLGDLIGSPIVTAEEISQDGPTIQAESYTWTFYRFATAKGTVTLRWLGTSNGYYSEGVSMEETRTGDESQVAADVSEPQWYVPKPHN